MVHDACWLLRVLPCPSGDLLESCSPNFLPNRSGKALKHKSALSTSTVDRADLLLYQSG